MTDQERQLLARGDIAITMLKAVSHRAEFNLKMINNTVKQLAALKVPSEDGTPTVLEVTLDVFEILRDRVQADIGTTNHVLSEVAALTDGLDYSVDKAVDNVIAGIQGESEVYAKMDVDKIKEILNLP